MTYSVQHFGRIPNFITLHILERRENNEPWKTIENFVIMFAPTNNIIFKLPCVYPQLCISSLCRVTVVQSVHFADPTVSLMGRFDRQTTSLRNRARHLRRVDTHEMQPRSVKMVSVDLARHRLPNPARSCLASHVVLRDGAASLALGSADPNERLQNLHCLVLTHDYL